MSSEDQKAVGNAESESKKPWESWPHELPTTKEFHECKLYFQIEDDAFHREMNAEIRATAFHRIKAAIGSDCSKSAVLMAGGTEQAFALYDTDCTKCPFRQESYFQYLFGINEPDCFGILDLNAGETILFVPFVPEDAERWNGPGRPLPYFVEKYGVDHAFHTSEILEVLKERGLTSLFVNHGQNSDSDAFTDLSQIEALVAKAPQGTFSLNKEILYPILTEMRVFKTEREISLLRTSALLSSQAHVYVMRHIKPGMTELQLEALFKAWTCYYGGSRHVAYTCICGCGPNAAILHYGHAGRPNDCILQDGDMTLLDMGGEFRGYATDITRSYPVNGKFTEAQTLVYNAVRAAQVAVFQQLKPGTHWPDMHRLAERTILSHLLAMGLLRGGTVEELMEAHMGAVFMPHGLGHFIGMDTHDVGGYTSGPERSKLPGLCWLRTARTLQAGMVLTVEPGCYFIEGTLSKALANEAQAKFIDLDKLEPLRGTGGVRLEDDVLITETGYENFTVLPSTVEEIEEVFVNCRT